MQRNQHQPHSDGDTATHRNTAPTSDSTNDHTEPGGTSQVGRSGASAATSRGMPPGGVSGPPAGIPAPRTGVPIGGVRGGSTGPASGARLVVFLVVLNVHQEGPAFSRPFVF